MPTRSNRIRRRISQGRIRFSRRRIARANQRTGYFTLSSKQREQLMEIEKEWTQVIQVHKRTIWAAIRMNVQLAREMGVTSRELFDDITSHIWMRMMAGKWPGFKKTTYIYRTAANQIRLQYREYKRKRKIEDPVDFESVTEWLPVKRVDFGQKDLWHTLVKIITPEDRFFLEKRMEGFSSPEAEKLLDPSASPENLRLRAHRRLQRIRGIVLRLIKKKNGKAEE